MEKVAPLRASAAPDEEAYADTHAAPLESIAELLGDGPTSEVAPPRGGAHASISSEAGHGVVVGGRPPDLAANDAQRYERGPLLGQGGMGEVYLHLDHVIGRHVARKTLFKEVSDERTFARFVREARVQGQLEHPSIVPVYDFGLGQDGQAFFTMKRVRGETLATILDALADRDPDMAARFSRHKLLAAFRQICLAVEYAHLRGVVHRDLKPSNIMLGDFGEVYLLDWGLAKLMSDPRNLANLTGRDTAPPSSDQDRTGPNDMIGTPAYMAPEQFTGQKNAYDPRQDVFSLGAILFEILTLTRYRPGASFATLLTTLLKEADRPSPARPSEKVPDIAPELDETCSQALMALPTARLASAGAIAEVIERYLEGDRDQGVRRSMATTQLASAQALVANGTADPTVRVAAMQGAIRALALMPDNQEAQELLLSLIVDGTGQLPPAVEKEFEESSFVVDEYGLRMGIYGLMTWFLALPFAMLLGIRDWRSVGLMVALTLASMAYLGWMLRARNRAFGHVLTIAGLLGTTIALSSAWLGPFILVPLATCGVSILFGSRCTPRERPWLILIWSLATLAPFGVELLHLFPPAYTFRGGELIIHPRAIDLPEGLTVAAVAYTSLTFLVLPMLFLGRLRDRQRDGDRRLFVQAWHLRQLFPKRTTPSSTPR